MTSPFDVLGLAASTGLSDDDVRAAWRRAAAATHPDRADGGDPAAFADAAAAYTLLRTAAGRSEAIADLREPGSDAGQRGPVPGLMKLLPGAGARLASRVCRGRPLRLAAARARRDRGREPGRGCRGLAAGQRRGYHRGADLAAAHRPGRPGGPALISQP